MSISFPIFVQARDSSEVYKFGSVYEAQNELEKIDVENQEYEAWDSNGAPIDLTVQKPVWLNLAIRTEQADVRSLPDALAQFARSVHMDLRAEELARDRLEVIVDRIRAEQEKQRLKKSRVRRLFANIRTILG